MELTLCQPCKMEDKNVTAVAWCSECEESLCKECQNYHKRMKMLQNHHLVKTELMSSMMKYSLTSSKNCEIHKDLVIDAFCASHDELCCRSCMTGSHRNCEDVKPLEVVAKSVKKSDIFQSIPRRLNEMIIASKKLDTITEANVNELNDVESKIKEEIKAAKRRIINKLDELEESAIQNLSKIRKDGLTKLSEQKQNSLRFSEMINSIQDEYNFINENGSNEQAFRMSHKCRNALISTEKSLTETISQSQCFSILCEDNSARIVNQMTMALCTLTFNSKPCNIDYRPNNQQMAQSLLPVVDASPNFVHVKTIEIKEKVFGITFTKDNDLLLCHYNNISKYNLSGQLLKTIGTYDKTHNIAVIGTTDQAVISFSNTKTLQFLKLGSMALKEIINIPDGCRGLAASSEKIVVGGLRALFVLNIYGDLLSTIDVTNKMDFPIQYVHLCNDGRILYTDTTAVYKVTFEGKLLWKYESEDLKAPQGIILDRFNRVYVAGQLSHAIFSLSENGKNQEKLLIRDADLLNPWAVCFNKTCEFLSVSGGIDPDQYVIIFQCQK